MNDLKKNVERLFRFDLIRVTKLLEMTQYTLITFILAFLSGILVDNICYIDITPETIDTISNIELITKILLQIILIVIFSYYIQKIVILIPFLFPLTKGYIPSMKNESIIGISLAMSMIYVSIQTNFKNKLLLLKERTFNITKI
jgi:hypothetical protein